MRAAAMTGSANGGIHAGRPMDEPQLGVDVILGWIIKTNL
jgi:hypothetical protein